MGIGEIFLLYVCPAMGGVMSTIMFVAPINDMRCALARGSLGDLAPFPFAMMTGNTAGWLIYGYFTRDPFIIASNLPGFILSIWLNSGAFKLQYFELKEKNTRSISERNQVLQRWDADRAPEEDDGDPRRRRRRQSPDEQDGLTHNSQVVERLQMTPQEILLLRVLVFWSVVLIYTSWMYPSTGDPANFVGILVNINLVAFYAAPLKTMRTVISERNSASIHYETMIMNWINTSFWIGYGCARRDPVIVVPNATGLLLGLAQGALCVLYPRQSSQQGARISLHELGSDLRFPTNNSHDCSNNPEEAVPASSPAAVKRSEVPDTPEVI